VSESHRVSAASLRQVDAEFDDALRIVQARADEVPQAYLPVALAKLTTVAASVAARLAIATAPMPERDGPPPGDRLLTVEQAAEKLAVNVGWLYRHADRLRFTVRVSPRRLRFSERGIDKYIAQRCGA